MHEKRYNCEGGFFFVIEEKNQLYAILFHVRLTISISKNEKAEIKYNKRSSFLHVNFY
jgi:hypothetical protein